MPTLKELLQTRLSTKNRQPIGMSAGMPDYGYGNRYQEPSADLTKGKYGVELRNLYPSEDNYFKKNTHVGGMATDDNKVIINPYSRLNDKERQAILMNESARVHMRTGNINAPEFTITPEQKKAFESYSPDLNDIKQTIAARVLTGDPSALNKTSEQINYANKLKNYMAEPKIAQPKGVGYYGEVARPDSGYSTEIGIGTNAYGEIPTMVPGLSENQLVNLLTMGEEDRVPDDIAKKAISHAAWRKLQGQSPWAGINDQQTLLPRKNGSLLSDYWNK